MILADRREGGLQGSPVDTTTGSGLLHSLDRNIPLQNVVTTFDDLGETTGSVWFFLKSKPRAVGHVYTFVSIYNHV